MKPAAIFQHSPVDLPGNVTPYLARAGIPATVFRPDLGQPVPADSRAFCGLVFLGGAMSVNDPLPWLEPELNLIRHAVREDVPVIGHCLGGQLLSKALGGRVTRAPAAEIGWTEVRATHAEMAKEWFGESERITVFQWHSETFSIPQGATRIAANDWCANQAFVIGKHFGMQFHVEVTEEIVTGWVRTGTSEIEASCALPSVQRASEIAADLEWRVADLQRLSGRIYDRWIQGLDGR